MSLLKDKLSSIRLVPVVTPYSVEGTVELAKTLVAGGVDAIEITLRTELALEATQAVKDSGIDIVLGVGTLTSVSDVKEVAELGVDFAVSPGMTPTLLDAARDYELKIGRAHV